VTRDRPDRDGLQLQDDAGREPLIGRKRRATRSIPRTIRASQGDIDHFTFQASKVQGGQLGPPSWTPSTPACVRKAAGPAGPLLPADQNSKQRRSRLATERWKQFL
jgi:hypothetical protein